MGCHHCTVDSSVPTMQPRVRVPITPFTLLSLFVLSKRTKNKQKETGFGPYIRQEMVQLCALADSTELLRNNQRQPSLKY